MAQSTIEEHEFPLAVEAGAASSGGASSREPVRLFWQANAVRSQGPLSRDGGGQDDSEKPDLPLALLRHINRGSSAARGDATEAGRSWVAMPRIHVNCDSRSDSAAGPRLCRAVELAVDRVDSRIIASSQGRCGVPPRPASVRAKSAVGMSRPEVPLSVRRATDRRARRCSRSSSGAGRRRPQDSGQQMSKVSSGEMAAKLRHLGGRREDVPTSTDCGPDPLAAYWRGCPLLT